MNLEIVSCATPTHISKKDNIGKINLRNIVNYLLFF